MQQLREMPSPTSSHSDKLIEGHATAQSQEAAVLRTRRRPATLKP